MAIIKNLRSDKFNHDTDVYCGRSYGDYKGSIWGNPFPLTKDTIEHRIDCIDRYTAYLKSKPALVRQLPTLIGKNLACWCRPKLCHCEVLHRYVNPTATHVRVVLSGSRSFDKRSHSAGLKKIDSLANRYFDQLESEDNRKIIVIHGTAVGWDTMVSDVATQRGYDVLPIPAQWRTSCGDYNPRAGMERNTIMLSLADRLFIGHDGKSRGTLDLYKKAMGLNPSVDIHFNALE